VAGSVILPLPAGNAGMMGCRWSAVMIRQVEPVRVNTHMNAWTVASGPEM